MGVIITLAKKEDLWLPTIDSLKWTGWIWESDVVTRPFYDIFHAIVRHMARQSKMKGQGPIRPYSNLTSFIEAD